MNRHFPAEFALCVVVAVTMAATRVAPSTEPTTSPAPRELRDRSNRFLDQPWPKAELAPSMVSADSFEDMAETTKYWRVDKAAFEQSDQHAIDGARSLKVVFQNGKSSLGYRRGGAGWGNTTPGDVEIYGLRALHYDELRVEVFNPGNEIDLRVTAVGNFSRGFRLRSGTNSIVIPTADLRNESYRVSEIPGSVNFWLPNIAAEATLYFDHLRWTGAGLGKNLIRFARCFDFGEPYSVRPHFLGVTPFTGYSKERGYGWKQPATSPSQAYPPVAAGHLTARRPDDELLWDWICPVKTPLLVDLPDGKYRLLAVEHGIGFYQQSPVHYDLTVSFNGGPPQLLRKRAADLVEAHRFEYGLDQTDWVPNDDLWKKFRGHLIRPLEADFEVKGGQAGIAFVSKPAGFENLSFCIIYPVDKAAVVEPDIAALWQDLRYRFNAAFAPATPAMAKQMRLPGLHVEMDELVRAKRLSAISQRGRAEEERFVLFNRGLTEEVYPDSVPDPMELNETFAVAGTPGEIESFTPAVFAYRDLKDVKLEIGEFTGPNGAKIGRDRLDLRTVNCVYRMTGQQSHGDWRWMVVPWHLVKRPSVDIPAQTSRRWWLNVQIPAEAPAGVYKAAAVLQGAGLPRREFELTLHVLPFQLDPLPKEIEQSMAVVNPKWWLPLSDRAYGFIKIWVIYSNLSNFQKPENAPFQPIYEDALKLCLDRRVAELNLIKRYGFNLAYVDNFGIPPSVVESLKARPPMDLSWYCVDPPVGVEELRKAKFFTAAWQSPAMDNQTEGVIAKFKAEKQVPVVLAMNEAALGWSDAQQEAGIYRFEAGVMLWRLGALGGVYGPWYMPWRDPYNPTDGHVSEWGDFVAPASTGPQPSFNTTVILEGLREGIQDYRYIVTLERLARAKEGTPAAQEAQGYLKKLRERVVPNAAHYFEKVGRRGGWDNTWTQKDTAWKGSDYSEFRREVAGRIAELSKMP